MVAATTTLGSEERIIACRTLIRNRAVGLDSVRHCAAEASFDRCRCKALEGSGRRGPISSGRQSRAKKNIGTGARPNTCAMAATG